MTRSMTCQGEAVLAADDTESLIAPSKAHLDQQHPELVPTGAGVRNFLGSEDRATGPTERLGAIGKVEIGALTPGSGHVMQYFDPDADLFQGFGFGIVSEDPLVVGPDLA